MPLAAAVDAVLVVAWLVFLADGLRLAQRARSGATRGAPVRSLPLQMLVLAGALIGVGLLEQRAGGRLAFVPLAAVAGLLCVAAGLGLYTAARRALGTHWSSAIDVSPDRRLVTDGPYAVVRHPLYLGVWLLAAGTALAHASLATLCVMAGLTAGIAVKIPAEERALRAACGPAWTRYAAGVPALVPLPRRWLRRASP